MNERFLTREEVEAKRARGVEVAGHEDGLGVTVWHSANHGSFYRWNSLTESYQRASGAFRTGRQPALIPIKIHPK